MIYKFKGSMIPTKNSQEVGELLSGIRKEKGMLYTCDVVDKARPESSIIHKDFEWDDGVAAEEHRRSQARRLISSVEIVWEEGDNRQIVIPAFTHLRVDRRGYRDTEEVYAMPQLRSSLKEQLRVDWQTLKKKNDVILREMELFDDFDSEIDEVTK